MVAEGDSRADEVHPPQPAEVRATLRVAKLIAEQQADALVNRALAGVDPLRPYAEQVVPIAEGLVALGTPPCRLLLWRDTQGTAWIVDMNVDTSPHRPTPRDHQMRKTDQVRSWISDVRVVGPLLHKRVIESGEAGAAAFESGRILVSKSADSTTVQVATPHCCSPNEVRRLAMIAALCVSAAPGWQFASDATDEPNTLSLALRTTPPHE